MNRAESALYELNEMDELANGNSPVHHFSALAKLLVTVIYIAVTMSFDRYDLSGVLMMAAYPYILFQITGIPFRTCIYKLRYILPLIAFVGIFNPLLNRTVFVAIGRLSVSYGWLSFAVMTVKGILALSASFLLAATTRIDAVCAALRKLRMPAEIVTVILLMYRYVSVLVEEVAVMNNAYHLRAPGQKGIHYSAWGSFLGQLLLRSMDRAQELYASMELRGYHGEFLYTAEAGMAGRDWMYLLTWTAVIALLRSVPVIQIIGNLFV